MRFLSWGEVPQAGGANLSDRQYPHGGFEFGGGFGHAVDGAGGLVLGDRLPAPFAEFAEADRAVASHAGQ